MFFQVGANAGLEMFTDTFPLAFIVQLLLGSLTPGIALLVGRGWRALPLGQRLNTAFGFLAVGWACLLAFSIQTAPLDYGALLHFIVWALGAGLLIAYFLSRRRAQVSPELFP